MDILRDSKGRFVKGTKSLNYKGGRRTTKNDYVHILINGKYVPEHRLVWEKEMNCCLLSDTEVHHLNGNKRDNRIENLQAMRNSHHGHIHNPVKDMSSRRCNLCGEGEKGARKWHRDLDGYICSSCYIMVKWWTQKDMNRKK